MLTPNNFGAIGFGGTLRPSQIAASDIVRTKLAEGERRFATALDGGNPT